MIDGKADSNTMTNVVSSDGRRDAVAAALREVVQLVANGCISGVGWDAIGEDRRELWRRHADRVLEAADRGDPPSPASGS